jgi:hypothetical protein
MNTRALAERTLDAGIPAESVPDHSGPAMTTICGVTQFPLSPSIEDCLVRHVNDRAAEINRFLA